jgi:hypothetical protein
MVVQGTVHNGVVVPVTGQTLPEGAEVTIIVRASVETAEGSNAAPGRTLAERLQSVIGKATALPADMAAQHDHYIHGSPKR